MASIPRSAFRLRRYKIGGERRENCRFDLDQARISWCRAPKILTGRDVSLPLLLAIAAETVASLRPLLRGDITTR
jgi:hypothetical protein